MSITGAFTIAVSGLQVSTAATQVISSNVSNAQTAGYSRKSINLAAITDGEGGVQVTGYGRVSDSVLTATLNSSTSTASYLSTQNNYMTQVQTMLDSSSSPPALSSALSKFQAAWTEYSASPSDTTLEKGVILAGETLASTVTGISNQSSTLQSNVESDLSTSISALNAALKQINTFNSEIAIANATKQPTGNLEDQRDLLINSIAKYTNVTVLQRENGQVALYTPSGASLIDGQSVQQFSIINNGTSIANNIGADVSGILTGGSLQAQTDFLSTSASNANGVAVLNKIQSQLLAFSNLFVSTATGGFANKYNTATAGTGELASSFFSADTDAKGNISNLSSFAVNASLINGTATVKQAAASVVAPTFSATNLAIDTSGATSVTSTTFTASGLTTLNKTYAGISTAILSGFQQSANAIKSQYTTASTQQAYYQTSLTGETGVNTDTELVDLTNWENSYSASAHVISTLQNMMKTLENMVA